MSQALTLAKKPHILIATPGRLVDHLENTKGFNLRALKFLVRLTYISKVSTHLFQMEKPLKDFMCCWTVFQLHFYSFPVSPFPVPEYSTVLLKLFDDEKILMDLNTRTKESQV